LHERRPAPEVSVPFLLNVRALPERLTTPGFPFDLPFVPELDLGFSHPVTFFVGENGTGKSTLLEAIAYLARLPVSGGGREELSADHAPEGASALGAALRPSFRKRPRDGYFLRAEFHAHFASLLDQRDQDRDFHGDPYARYGGKSLHARSHGESFLALIQGRLRGGLILLDEPESALSPQRQLTLLTMMAGMVARQTVQFIIATHSPILLTYPGAHIVSFDDPTLPTIALRDTKHYQITKGILDSPDRYWKHLLGAGDHDPP
jgi:predicted ATPase